MYHIRTPGYSKRDPAMRWALPDRVFFACGACHILAHAFLDTHGTDAHEAVWVKPPAGLAANHIVVRPRHLSGVPYPTDWVFDYHGYRRAESFLSHLDRRARQRWPDWAAVVVPLPPEVLTSTAEARTFDAGLHLREPADFLHDALPRARRFLSRFPAPR